MTEKTEKRANLVKAGLSAILALVIWAMNNFGVLNLVLLPEEPMKWAERLSTGAIILALLLTILWGLYLKWVPGKCMLALFTIGLILSLVYYLLQTQWVVETNCQSPQAPQVYIDPGTVPESVAFIVEPHITIQDAWCDAQGKEAVWKAVKKAGATRAVWLIIVLLVANVALVLPILFAAWHPR